MTDSILRSYQYYSHTSMVPFPAPIPPFTTVDALPGVVLWMDATVDTYQENFGTPPSTLCTNATNCSTWLDQISGLPLYGNETTNPLSWRSADLNGLPSLRSGGNAGNRTHNGTTPFTGMAGADAYCCWVVGSFGNNVQDSGFMFTLGATGGGSPPNDGTDPSCIAIARRWGLNPALTTYFNSAGGLAATAQTVTYSTAGTADAPFRFSSFGDGSTITTYLNNANPLSDPYGSTMALASNASIGIMTPAFNSVTEGIGDNTAQAYISEIILCNGHDAEAYRADVDAYLETKWNF